MRRTFVERPASGKKAAYKEAILQLVRDVRLVLNGELRTQLNISNLQRIFPVMIGVDRSVRSVGVSPFLEGEFASLLTEDERQRVAGLTVWGLEDLEALDSLLDARTDLQRLTPRGLGLLKVLRRWDLDPGQAPSWWQFAEVEYGALAVNDELNREFEAFRASLPSHFRS